MTPPAAWRRWCARARSGTWACRITTSHQLDLLRERLVIPLVTNQIELSLFQMGALFDGTLDQCQRHRIRPMAWSPLGGGRLFAPTTRPRLGCGPPWPHWRPRTAMPARASWPWPGCWPIPSAPLAVLGTSQLEPPGDPGAGHRRSRSIATTGICCGRRRRDDRFRDRARLAPRPQRRSRPCRRGAPLAGVLAVTFFASVSGGAFWAGIYFVTAEHYHFSPARNLLLGAAMGLVYALAARFTGWLLRRLQRQVGPAHHPGRHAERLGPGGVVAAAGPRGRAADLDRRSGGRGHLGHHLAGGRKLSGRRPSRRCHARGDRLVQRLLDAGHRGVAADLAGAGADSSRC